MKKLLKFKSRRSFKQDVIITVALAVVIGSALGAFLLETPQDDTGASYDSANSTVLQGNINGIATVTDGDTIKINDTRIRFHGIDAPESGQTCIQKRPPQGISDEEIKAQEENLERYRDYILTFKDASSLFGILKSVLDNNENTDRVFVGTIHSAKGLEWDTVIIMGWEDGMLPQRQSISHRAFEEERRIAYVGITRAKNVLMLTYVKERDGQENVISPFIDEIFIDKISQDIIASDQTPLNDGNLNNSHDQFSGIYTSKNSDDDKLENFLQYLRKIREDVKNREEVKRKSITKIADGQGDGSGWSDQSAGTGLLAEVGYTVKKDGPLSDERQSILNDVLHNQLDLPDWISVSVQDQWGEPNTEERFFKIRNTINVALGQQKGRLHPSAQAIEKWEDDLTFLEEQLLPQVERGK